MRLMATIVLAMVMMSFLGSVITGSSVPNLCAEWRARESNLFLGITYECVRWEPRKP